MVERMEVFSEEIFFFRNNYYDVNTEERDYIDVIVELLDETL